MWKNLIPQPLVVDKNWEGYLGYRDPPKEQGHSPTPGPQPRVPVQEREVPITLAVKTQPSADCLVANARCSGSEHRQG